MIDWPSVQNRLRVKVDGDFGPISYRALLSAVAGHDVSPAIASAMAANAGNYGVDCNPQRLSAFIGQTCHESGGYQVLREAWGPTAAQKNYEGRADLGNTHPGDGYEYRGRGLIQITGRATYARIGAALGLDLVNHPELAEQPAAATTVSLEWWKNAGMNAVADTGDAERVTRRVNGGTTGLSERKRLTAKALELLA